MILQVRNLYLVLCFGIYIFCITACSSNSKKEKESTNVQSVETTQLVNDFIHKELKEDSVVICDKPMDVNYDGCFKFLISKDHEGRFSKFNVENKTDDNFIWIKTAKRFSRVLNQEFITELYKDDNWDKFNPTGKSGFYVFSKPIFSNDHKMAIMRSKFICGAHCGGGALYLFKKVQSHWLVVYRSCETIS